MDLHTLARRIDDVRAVEAALFEALGRWMHEEADPAVVTRFGEEAQRRATHVERWDRRRPAQVETTPVPAATPAALAAATTAERVAALRAVAAELDATYRAWRATVDPRVDGPTARTLDELIASGVATLIG